MRKGLSQTANLGIAVLIVAGMIGIAYGAWRLVSGFHPTPTPASGTPDVPSAQSASAVVDPGAPLGHRPAPNFTLTNQFGQRVSLDHFRGKIVVLTFIDSRCTTVCPLTAVVLKNLMYDLGSDRKYVQLVAVNANPIATSVKDVYDWSASHGMLHQWQYLTGSAHSLEAVWRHYMVATQVLHGSLVEHIAAVYVIDRQGREHWLYLNSSQGNTPVLALEVKQLIDHIAPLLPGSVSPNRLAPARELEYLPSELGPLGKSSRSFSLTAVMPNGALKPIAVGNGLHPTLLEFFATWCPDCQEETPTLKQYSALSLRDKNLPPLVAVDLRQTEASTAHVVHYALEQHLPFPIALDSRGQIAYLYGITGIPTQVLVSSRGHILWYHQGLIGLKTLQRQILQSLAK
ncbi:MAG: redoxin domain-containing protein [Bacilli bacterium]